MNKNGDIADLSHFVTVIFVLGIIFFIGGILWFNVVTPVTNKIVNLTDNAETQANIEASFDSTERAINILDPLFVFFFFGFYLVLLISVFFLDTSPGFMIFAIIGLIIVIFVGGVIADAWINIENEMDLELLESGKVSPATSFEMTNHVVSNIPIYLSIMSSIFLIVLYASKRRM